MSQEISKELSTTLKKWRNKRGNLIMVLQEIQSREGYVPREVALQVAKELNIPLARIWEVLTFYNFFKLVPPGKFVISTCLGTACYLKGGAQIMDAIKEKLGIEDGETTKDGMFHLQGVRCVGCCGQSPVLIVNGKIYPKVKLADVTHIINECESIGLDSETK